MIVAGLFTLFAPRSSPSSCKFFPPVVTGTVITIIGITLIPVAAFDAGGGQFAFFNPDLVPADLRFGSLTNLSLAFFTIVVILAAHALRPRVPGHRRRARRTGHRHAVAAFVTDGSGGKVAKFDSVGGADWVGFTGPFHFGTPKFSVVPILLMIVVMMITAVETTGDVYATGQIVEKPIARADIAAALRADGLATFLGGVMNSFPYTCFAENVGLVRLTQVKSRWVVASAGAIMILLGLLPKAGAIVDEHPALGAGRGGAGDVRDRRGRGHPDPRPGGLQQPPQRDRGRRQRRHRDDPGRPAAGERHVGVPRRDPAQRPAFLNSGITHGQHHRDPAQPVAQPLGWPGRSRQGRARPGEPD